jgi:hypothetical protein
MTAAFAVNMVFGHYELRDWFELQPDGSLLGMGQKTLVHPDGRREIFPAESTGCRLWLGGKP